MRPMRPFKDTAVAIRAGAKKVIGQCVGSFIQWNEDDTICACATGCVGLSYTDAYSVDSMDVDEIFNHAHIDNPERTVSYWKTTGIPAHTFNNVHAEIEDRDMMGLAEVCACLNDFARWSLEQIASWIEGLTDELD